VLVVLFWVLLWQDPLLKGGTKGHPHDSKQINPFKSKQVFQHVSLGVTQDMMKVKVEDVPIIFGEFSDAKNVEIHKLIGEYFLNKDTKAASKASVTPLQASMVMMGCYGNPLKNDDARSIYTMSKDNLGQNDDLLQSFYMNFMLQAYEDLHLKSSTAIDLQTTVQDLLKTQDKSDKSVCSCLKAFASPSLFHLGPLLISDPESSKHESEMEDITCEHRKFMHDSCSVQRTLDYALDGDVFSEFPKTNVSIDHKKYQIRDWLTISNENKNHARHRMDPLYVLLNNYTGAENLNAEPSEPWKKFIEKFCLLAPQQCEDAQLTKTTSPKKLVMQKLKTMVQWIKPHNRLRPPILCAKSSECTVSERGDGMMSQATYKAYIDQYKHAFDTCKLTGVPIFVRASVSNIDTAIIYSMAENWLLLAAVFAFVWSYYVERELKTSSVQNDVSSYYVVRIIMFLFICTTWGFLFAKIIGVMSTLVQHEKKNIFINFGFYHDLFVTEWYFLIISALTVVALIVASSIYYVVHKKSNVQESETMAVAQVVHDQPSEPVRGVILPHKAFMFETEKLIRPTYPKGRSNEGMKKLDEFEREGLFTNRLQKMAALAQIATDLCLILGLTSLAIACVTQRNVGDWYLIMNVFVWFFCIGIIVHMSNIMRLVHVYVQFHHESQTDCHAHVVPSTRTGFAVVIGIMLFIYLRLAGLDSESSSPHTVGHQTLFAVLSLVMLCGADAIDAAIHRNKPCESLNAELRHDQFWQHVSSKNYYVAWIVIFSLYFLHLTRSSAICAELKSKSIGSDNFSCGLGTLDWS
jgi:hypothetical protein